MQSRTNSIKKIWYRLFSAPASPTPYHTILSEAKEEGYDFRIFAGSHDYVVPAENAEIFFDKITVTTDESTNSIEYSKLVEIQTRLKTKTVNLILREESTWRDSLIYLIPILLSSYIFTFAEQLSDFIQPDPFYAVMAVGAAIFVIGYFFIFYSAYNTRKIAENIRTRAVTAGSAQIVIRRLEKAAADNDEKKYFSELITNNVDNIRRYYSLIEEQANKSYRLTINVAIAGFILLFMGVSLSFAQGLDKPASALTVASGLLIEFISAVFFYLYNNTVRELNKYHDKLIKVQNTMLALRVVQLIENDDTKKNDTLQSLTLALLPKDETPNEQQNTMEVQENPNLNNDKN